MRLTLEHRHVASTDALDTWIEERILALRARLQIDEARVRLEHQRERSPAFRVRVHLVTPGPDLVSETREHTLRAALDRALTHLREQIMDRTRRRLHQLRAKRTTPARGRLSRTNH